MQPLRHAFNSPRLILMGLSRDMAEAHWGHLLECVRQQSVDVSLFIVDDGGKGLGELMQTNRPMLFALCQTAEMDVGLRLRIKRSFVAHARPSHRLLTLWIDGGARKAWLAIAAHLMRLSSGRATAPVTPEGRPRRRAAAPVESRPPPASSPAHDVQDARPSARSPALSPPVPPADLVPRSLQRMFIEFYTARRRMTLETLRPPGAPSRSDRSSS